MKNKGITLIALVITIIIMLILVAVTVSYSIKSGLLSKTQVGKEEYKYKEEEDEIGAIRLEYLADEKTGKVDGDLLDYLTIGLQGKAEIIQENGIITVTYLNGNSHEIKKEEEIEANDDFTGKVYSYLRPWRNEYNFYIFNDKTYTSYSGTWRNEKKEMFDSLSETESTDFDVSECETNTFEVVDIEEALERFFVLFNAEWENRDKEEDDENIIIDHNNMVQAINDLKNDQTISKKVFLTTYEDGEVIYIMLFSKDFSQIKYGLWSTEGGMDENYIYEEKFNNENKAKLLELLENAPLNIK